MDKLADSGEGPMVEGCKHGCPGGASQLTLMFVT
jgi:hypothetical protein